MIQHSFDLIVRGVLKYNSSGFTRTRRTAEVFRVVHINPAKVDVDPPSLSRDRGLSSTASVGNLD